MSFAAALLKGGADDLEVAAHIWVSEAERADLSTADVPVEPKGLPASVDVRWHDQTTQASG